MRRLHGPAGIMGLILLLGPWVATAGEAGPGDANKTRVKTHTVKEEPFKVVLDFAGVFEAAEYTEVSLDTDVWTDFTVVEAVHHGAVVEAGETLVRLDQKKIDRKLEDLQLERDLASLGVQQVRIEIEMLERSIEIDLPSEERKSRVAQENLHRFLETDRPLSERSARRALQGAGFSLEYAEEELRQLEKMYKADDLTEETEEIILKRQRRSVENAKFRLERARVNHDRTTQVNLPREQEKLQDGSLRASLTLDRARAIRPLELQKKRVELQKLERKQARVLEELQQLRRDREALTVVAPVAGLVYYGRCTRGRWSDATAMASKQLRPGGRLAVHDVFMTVVNLRPLRVRATLQEAQLADLRVGLATVARPKAIREVDLPAEIQSISRIPVTGEAFDCLVSVQLGEESTRLVPGMTCDLKCTVYEDEDAITVPVKAVHGKGAEARVKVLAAEGPVTERPVNVGRTHGGRVEILEGLEPGEQVLLEEKK